MKMQTTKKGKNVCKVMTNLQNTCIKDKYTQLPISPDRKIQMGKHENEFNPNDEKENTKLRS